MRYGRDEAYDVSLVSRAGGETVARLAALMEGRRALICTTPTVFRRHREVFDALAAVRGAADPIAVLNVAESGKDMAAVIDICRRAQASGIGRRDLLVAVSGGVCSDLVRTAAGLIRRGIGHVCVPTTLIGQIDAGIGIKGGINFEGTKSYLGVFRAPEAVLIDPAFLATVSRASLEDGMAEIVKLATSLDKGLFEAVEAAGPDLIASNWTLPAAAGRQMLRRSIELTLSELADDPLELGTLRRTLDFGHTFSPLIEAASGYAISHGRAVAIDICISAAVAVALGRLPAATAERIVQAIAAAGLPVDCAFLDEMLLAKSLDAAAKHRGGKPNLVIPTAIGACDFVTERALLTDGVLERSLLILRALASPPLRAVAVTPPRPAAGHKVARRC